MSRLQCFLLNDNALFVISQCPSSDLSVLQSIVFHSLTYTQVSALPTVVAFKNGKVANKFGRSCLSGRSLTFAVGFRNEGDVKKFLGLL